jgi:hypothetical protein
MQYCSDAVNNPREKLTAFLRMPRFERIFFSSSTVTGEILYQLNFALSLQTEDIGCAVIFQPVGRNSESVFRQFSEPVGAIRCAIAPYELDRA